MGSAIGGFKTEIPGKRTSGFNLVLLLSILFCTAAPAFGHDLTYRDSRHPSFSLLVPDGWQASVTKAGVNLTHGTPSNYAQLAEIEGAEEPGAMLVQLRPQFERQYKDFRGVASGRTMFGGGSGAYVIYAGIPPSGVRQITRVVTMTTGHMTYVLFIGVHADEYERLKADINRIQSSFAPD